MNETLIAVLFCFGGLAMLVKSANILIDGGLTIAHKLKWSQMLIGLTLLAFGTSAPEMVVNFLASYRGHGDIVTGNIIGSNLANLVFGIGTAALFMPLVFSQKNLRLDIPLGLIGVLFFFIASAILKLNHFITGGVMLAVFALYLWQAFHSDEISKEQGSHTDTTLAKAIILTVLGLLGLFLGGMLTVDGATDIAHLLGIRESLIALTVIAVGTSAPEVITCIQATRRGHPDIAIGNVAGSQIFNGLWVLGGSSVIANITYNKIVYQDLAMLVAATLFLVIAKKAFANKYSKLCGIILIASYITYLAYVITYEII